MGVIYWGTSIHVGEHISCWAYMLWVSIWEQYVGEHISHWVTLLGNMGICVGYICWVTCIYVGEHVSMAGYICWVTHICWGTFSNIYTCSPTYIPNIYKIFIYVGYICWVTQGFYRCTCNVVECMYSTCMPNVYRAPCSEIVPRYE